MDMWKGFIRVSGRMSRDRSDLRKEERRKEKDGTVSLYVSVVGKGGGTEKRGGVGKGRKRNEEGGERNKFHILRHALGSLEQVRKQEFVKAKGRFRGLLCGKKFVLLARKAHVRGKAREALNDLLTFSRKTGHRAPAQRKLRSPLELSE